LEWRRILTVVAVLAVTLIGFGSWTGETPSKFTLEDIVVEVVPDKQEYRVGDTITAVIFFVNERSTAVYLDPISFFAVSGNYVDDPKPVATQVNVDYVRGFQIEVPANGRYSFFKIPFKATRAGDFRISCLGKTVVIRVSG